MPYNDKPKLICDVACVNITTPYLPKDKRKRRRVKRRMRQHLAFMKQLREGVLIYGKYRES